MTRVRERPQGEGGETPAAPGEGFSDCASLSSRSGPFRFPKGSHRNYRHPTKPGKVTIAGKLSTDVPSGTWNNILKPAGFKKVKRLYAGYRCA
ncbi:MAG: type II toxin-antitoxin system HicA family toxin [Acidobacteria bacterium]|nr:type II toxin-antitoxin system HicA family toxin [Acidobacteriota bacterium]